MQIDVLDDWPGPRSPHMISENPPLARGRWRGRPRTRTVLEDVPRLHLPSLIADGTVMPGEVQRTAHAWSAPDGREVLVTIVAEMKADRGQIVVQPRAGRAYVVQVVSDPQPFGGRRWWFVCPITRRRAAALYQPWEVAPFASRQAHGLTYRTQRLDTRIGERRALRP